MDQDGIADARGESSTVPTTGNAKGANEEPSCPLYVVQQHEENSLPASSLAHSSSVSSQSVRSCLVKPSAKPRTNSPTDLAIALTNKDIGQEIHILFILVLLSITIFFCHSLIRLCMLVLNPPRETERQPVPNLTAPEGFQPIVPIPVRLARDDELDSDNDMADLEAGDIEKEILPPPPPAYGLWRSSVRVDPNLRHLRPSKQERLCDCGFVTRCSC
jgi:hypothetical protein